MADAIIVAYARGKMTFFPAKTDEVIDIVLGRLGRQRHLLATAEAMVDPGQHRVYQACTGSNNPILLGDVINHFQDESKRNLEKYGRLFYTQPKHEFRVVSITVFC